MRYTRARIASFGYELAPVVVTTDEIEERLSPVYERLHIPRGQLLSWTGIEERRWWHAGDGVAAGAVAAGRKAVAKAGLAAGDLGALIYAGVCREAFEPATACDVAAGVGVARDAAVHDVANACLGVVNGIVDVANRIELGQIRAGLVVAFETARRINEIAIARLLAEPTMEYLRGSLTTLTGGSGAAAVLVTDGSFGEGDRQRVLGAVQRTAPEHHDLCRWGIRGTGPTTVEEYAVTDSVGVLTHGSQLGFETWQALLAEMGWSTADVDRIVAHQIGRAHRESMLAGLGLRDDQDYVTYPYLGNMGTVALPLTAALAEERGFLESGQNVGFLGIGSGLNCLMLGVRW